MLKNVVFDKCGITGSQFSGPVPRLFIITINHDVCDCVFLKTVIVDYSFRAVPALNRPGPEIFQRIIVNAEIETVAPELNAAPSLAPIKDNIGQPEETPGDYVEKPVQTRGLFQDGPFFPEPEIVMFLLTLIRGPLKLYSPSGMTTVAFSGALLIDSWISFLEPLLACTV